MSLLRALRAYVGLGPDEDYEVGGLMPSVSGQGRKGPSMAGNDDYWSYGASPTEGRERRRLPAELDDHDSGPGPDARRRAVTASRSGEPERKYLEQDHVDDDSVVDLRSEDPGRELDGDRDDDREWDENRDDGDVLDGSESGERGGLDESGHAVVRSLDAVRARPKTVAPDSFAEAKELADVFRHGVPVVLNLHGIERDLARRLIDFASGVCYCMDGTMEKVGSSVFLLTPDGVEIDEEDRLRILQRGYAR